MENYGFQLAEPSEVHLPSSMGSFEDLYMVMNDIIKRDRSKELMFGDAPFMTHNEKRISFLNSYFVFKKIRNITNTAQITKEFIEKFTGELPPLKEAIASPIVESIPKPKIKKIKKVIVIDQEPDAKEVKEKKEEPKEEPKQVPRTKKEEKELEKQKLKEEKELQKQKLKEEKELEKQKLKEEKELQKQKEKEEKQKKKEDHTKTKKIRKE